MQFRVSGYGPALARPVALSFEAASLDEACLGGLRLLEELPECDRVELTGGGYVMEFRAELPAGVATANER